MKKLLVVLFGFFLVFSASSTSFAESVQQNTSTKITASDIETIQNALNRPNPDGTPAQNTNNESQDSISTQAITINTITPIFIRANNTSTTVYVYLAYNGQDAANAIKFTTMKINNTSLLFPKTYTSFPAKVYNFGVVANSFNLYLGTATIPTSETKVRVSDGGLMAYQVQFGWKSFTNIIGEWPIQ